MLGVDHATRPATALAMRSGQTPPGKTFMLHTVYISAVLDAPADRVWQAVRDFNSLPSYHPAITASTLEEGRAGDQVGTVRHLTLPDGAVRERLVQMDDRRRMFTYEIVEGVLPVRDYVSSVRVLPVTTTRQSFVEWYADFTVTIADAQSVIDAIGRDVFAAGLRGLATKLAG
jgi:hypothetical protein